VAFPTTVTTNLDSYSGVGGPYVSSSNAVYILGRYTPSGSQIQVFKATDPLTSFAGVGVNPDTTNIIRALGACQIGDNIHVVTRDANDATTNRIRYHRFNMATDTWDVSAELVRNTYTCAGAVDTSVVGIAVRSAGDKLVIYEGPQVLADIQRSRVYYARHLGTAWSADIALDSGGNSHWNPAQVIVGSGNRVHFFFSNTTLADQYQRCLDSSNALEAMPASFDPSSIADPDDAAQRAVAFSGTAGGTVVCMPYFKSFAPAWNDVRFSSADAPTPLTLRTINTGTITPDAGIIRHTFSFANDGPVLYSVFNSQNGNLYIASATETGAWNAPAQLVGSASASEVFTTVFTRNGSIKVGVCYTRNLTDVMYTEYTLSIAPSLMTDHPDTFSASGRAIVTARLSATEAHDLFSVSGRVLPIVNTGALSVTDVRDKFSASGYAIISARLSATDITDIFSASGNLINSFAASGLIAATESFHDKFSASGQVIVRGRLSATGVSDLFSCSATTLTPQHGSISWTEHRDIFSAPRANPSLGRDPGTSNAGGGAGRSNRENVPVPVDLWAAREAYLQSLFPEGPAPVVDADNTEEWAAYERRQQQIVNMTAERAHEIVELRNSSDLQSMKQHGARITELTAKIANLTGKQSFTRFMH
jgi:hypothetical protein